MSLLLSPGSISFPKIFIHLKIYFLIFLLEILKTEKGSVMTEIYLFDFSFFFLRSLDLDRDRLFERFFFDFFDS